MRIEIRRLTLSFTGLPSQGSPVVPSGTVARKESAAAAPGTRQPYARAGLEAEALANEKLVQAGRMAMVAISGRGPMLQRRDAADSEPPTIAERIASYLTTQASGDLRVRLPVMSTAELTELVRKSVSGADLLRDSALQKIIEDWRAARTPSLTPAGPAPGAASTPGSLPGTGGQTSGRESSLGGRLSDFGRLLGRIPTSAALGDPRVLEVSAGRSGLQLSHERPGLKLSAGIGWDRVVGAEAAAGDLKFTASADVLGGEGQKLTFGLQYGPDAPDLAALPRTFQPAGQAAGHALVNLPRFVSYLREGGVDELKSIPDAAEQVRRIAGERDRKIPFTFGLTAEVNRGQQGPPGVSVMGNLTFAWDVLKKAKAGAEPASATSVAIPRGGGQPLDARVLEKLEGFFGRQLPQVRIHTGPAAETAAAGLKAEAFTLGRDIYFGEGKFAPESKQGLGLLGHELTHVLQQEEGRATGMRRAGGDNGSLEREAETIARVVQTASSTILSGALIIGAYRRTYRPADGQPLANAERAALDTIAMLGREACERILQAEHPSVLSGDRALPRLRMSFDVDLASADPAAAAQAWGRKMAETIVSARVATNKAGMLAAPDTAAAVTARVQRKIGWPDASTKGQAWNAPPSTKDELKAVGGIWRVPIAGLTRGYQGKAPTSKGAPSFTTESAEGRAIVLVPKVLDPKQEVEVFLHFHGYGGRQWKGGGDPYAGWRERESDATVRDVALDRVEQQLETAGTGQTVGVLPQGGLKSEFGKLEADRYVDDVLKEVAEGLKRLGVWPESAVLKPARVVLSAHSGGGHIVRDMIRGNAASLPGALGELVLFDAINVNLKKGYTAELEAVTAWVDVQLEAALRTVKDAAKSDSDKLAAITSAPKLRGYYTDAYKYAYGKLEEHICTWFKTHRQELGPYADAVWANYQLVHLPTLAHEELMRGSKQGDKSAKAGEGNIADALRALHAPSAREPLDKVCPAPTGSSTPAREPRKSNERQSSPPRGEPEIPREAPVVNPASAVTKGKREEVREFSTSQGRFQRFSAGVHRRNSSNRPLFRASKLEPYSGAGSSGQKDIHPAVAGALNDLMSALIAEGRSTNDESMKQAVVGSAYRPPTEGEGRLYLKALRKTIRQNPKIFGEHVLTPELEAMAQEELGFSGSGAMARFRDAVAAAWSGDRQLAAKLLSITGGFKAARGGSTHHSGVVVDIDFPYVTKDGKVRWHGMNRERNADAFRSAAGQWLLEHAAEYGFASYNTANEIWHQEWLHWHGTDADTEIGGHTAAAPSVRPAAAAEVKPTAAAKQRQPERTTEGTGEDADKKDSRIEALGLVETARAAAYALKKNHPTIKFTSGRRNKDDQARAMAQNVVLNRKWIEETYGKSKARDACQKWLDDHPDKTTQDAIEAGLQSVLDGLTDAEVRRLSKHLAGEAFDVKPVRKDAETIKATIRGLPGLKKFLEKEGGLVRWHAQF